MTDFTFKRYGPGVPASYGVYHGDVYLGAITARFGRPGQSRSRNQYTATGLTRGGNLRADPMPGVYVSRKHAADALLRAHEERTPTR